MVSAADVALPVSAEAIVSEIERLGISHVVNVPDTHQRTVLEVLARRSHPKLLTACTEDEAIAMNAGLYIGGQTPMLLIQQTGLLAALNNVKGISMDANIPTFMLVGLYGRDVTKTARDNEKRVINLIEPTLEEWGIPCYPLESPDDIHVVAEAYQRSIDERGPTVVLVGAPTS